MGVLMKHVQEAPPPPRTLNTSLPEALDTVILACLQKDPSRRPQSAGEVLDRLSRLSAGTDTADVAA